ncbi:MAG: hypothetical protein AB1798_06665 [Spirochaetota bacterium]
MLAAILLPFFEAPVDRTHNGNNINYRVEKYLCHITEKSGIRQIHSFPGNVRNFSEQHIFDLIGSFASQYETDLILYGGQTATERIYGYKRMRSITNDLDYVCTFKGVKRIIDNLQVLYHPEFDILLILIQGIPVTFTYKHIHNWIIPEDFMQSVRPVRLNDYTVLCCAPEYSILLKFCRAFECIQQGRRIFGKDAIDIINMLTAPYFNSSRSPVDVEKVGRLLKTHVTEDCSTVIRIMEEISCYENHLPVEDVPVFKKIYRSCCEEITGRKN